MRTEETNQVEELTNNLIGVIWPELDAGTSKPNIMATINNVLDSWEPVQAETSKE